MGIAITVSTVDASSADALFGQPHAAAAFEAERLGDHGDGERIEFLGQSTRSPAPRRVPVPPPRPAVTNTMSAPCSSLDDLVGVLERGLPADLRVRAGAQTVGHLGAELQFVGHGHAASAWMSVFMA